MYLQKIQKVFKIVEIVVKVLMIVSFVGGGILFICGIMGLSGNEEIVTKIGEVNVITPVLQADPSKALTAEGAQMITEGISLILSGVIFLFAVKYTAQEQKDGTPFTKSGAESVKKLGIISMALSLAAAVIQGIFFAVLGVDGVNQISNDVGLTLGLLLLFFSLILNYGVQLKEGKADEVPAEKTEQ